MIARISSERASNSIASSTENRATTPAAANAATSRNPNTTWPTAAVPGERTRHWRKLKTPDWSAVHRLAGAVLLTAACDDPFAPVDWDPEPVPVDLFSVSRPDLLGLPSAYDFVNRRRVRLEEVGAAGQWDIALAEEDGAFVVKPSGAFQGVPPGPGVTVMERGRTFEDVTRAPDGLDAYVRTESVPLEAGRVYVVRTRRTTGFLGACIYYGKFEVMEMLEEEGRVRLQLVVNPNCNNRSLIPPGG
jgi:hypothetical protein